MTARSSRVFALLLAILSLLALRPAALAETYTGTVNDDQVFLRTRADTGSDYYDKLDKGTKVTLLGVRGDFFKVRYKTYTGYMMKKFINAPRAALSAFGASDRTESRSRYAGISTISGLGGVPRETRRGSSGDSVEKLQRALQIRGYYSGALDGIYGDGTADAVRRYQRAAGLETTGAADRRTLRKLFGLPDEVSARDDPGMDGITSISKIEVPNTSRPGNSGRHVKALQQALKLKGYYKAAIDSSYGQMTQDAVRRYQRATGLKADGIAGFSTIRRLFGRNAANYTLPTERLDWFNGGRNVIPQWTTFTVKDVSTGKIFRARRWSGANHLDAEPLSRDDARVMKEISGGSYSWARRAVLVKYNGKVYAASINTMPHGSDTIPENNYSGHFCIHFFKSKTHDTDRVDATHQNAVARAMNASW